MNLKRDIGNYLRRCMGLPDGNDQQVDAAFEGLVRVLMFFGTRGIMEAMREGED